MLTKIPLALYACPELLEVIAEGIKGRCKRPALEITNEITTTSNPKAARNVADIDRRTIPITKLVRKVLGLFRTQPALQFLCMDAPTLDDVAHEPILPNNFRID